MDSLFIYISIGVLVLIIVAGIVINNQIIAKKNSVLQAFGSIEIYLKKRFDLLPNLVSTLNKYMSHEREIMIKVTELRTKVEQAQQPSDKIKLSNELTQLVGGLNLNVENYPELKADKQFLNLQYELSNIEDLISAARRSYNASVTSYNNKIQKFPASIIAKFRKDTAEQLLEIPKAEQKEVNINQLFN